MYSFESFLYLIQSIFLCIMASSLRVKCIYPASCRCFLEAMLPIYISSFIRILSKLNEISGYLRFIEMKTVIEICVQFRVF